MAFLVCGDFGGESGLRKVGLGGTHPLTRRYATQVNLGVQSFGISPAIRFVLSANELFILRFLVNSNRKTDKILGLPQSFLALARCEFSGCKVRKGQVNRLFRTC
ncbi:hypothetical protein [Vibrio navarrensis]|uniref:hypothetical protein n=1 Tax=Vibrio navarrensis TaxID=29495 RepID=UPI003CC7CD2C